MGLRVEITTDSVIADRNHQDTIKNVCSECTLGYDDELYTGVHLTDDESIRAINNEFRDIDKATDVLSFPLLIADNGNIEYTDLDRDMETGEVILGDIIISLERMQAQAWEYGHSDERELAFLACHGMLHLLGYDHDDKDDEKIMIKRQKEILEGLGYGKGD